MIKNKFLLTILMLFFLFPVTASAKNLLKEKYYRSQWCQGKGEMDVVLPDKNRCDCLTDTHAVEVEFGKKWAEAIGQSLYYSLQTGKRAGIVLIIESNKYLKYWIRLNSTIEHFSLPIDTWQVLPFEDLHVGSKNHKLREKKEH